MKLLLLVAVAVVFPGSLGFLHAQAPDKGYSPAIKSTLLLRTDKTSTGQPVVYPQVTDPEVTAVFVEIPAGAETGWHKHPFPSYGYILSGKLSVETEGGKVEHYTAGQALVEMVNMSHNGRNAGTEPVKLVMFVTGEKNKAFTIKDAAIPAQP